MSFSSSRYLFLALSLSFLLTACGGGGGGGVSAISDAIANPKDNILSGILVDSPISGAYYETDTLSGLTDADGTFHYRKDETVTFSIGTIVLGSAPGKDVIMPVDFSSDTVNGEMSDYVINLARFLQTLDEDGDASNGIAIEATTRDTAEYFISTIDFDQPTTDFETDSDLVDFLSTLVDANVLDTAALLPEDQATEHIIQSLASFYPAPTFSEEKSSQPLDETVVTWTYDPALESEIDGFRLYRDGSVACEIAKGQWTYDAQADQYQATCSGVDTDGSMEFTMTAFTASDESPHSSASIANQAPTAQIEANGVSGNVFSFDGTGSADLDGTITSYQWDLGDGTTASDSTVLHDFGNGTYAVSLTVTDDKGASATVTLTALLVNS